MKNKDWGYHIIFDCAKGNIDFITDIDYIKNVIATLISEIDMVPYGNILIDRFALHDPEKAGVSFCQMIETSHIAGHFCENTGDFYIDVFSCKDFDPDVVCAIISSYFQPENMNVRILPRNANNFGE